MEMPPRDFCMLWSLLRIAADTTCNCRQIFELDEFRLFVRLFHGGTSFPVGFMLSRTLPSSGDGRPSLHTGREVVHVGAEVELIAFHVI